MPEWPYVLSAVLICSAVTWTLRAMPFLVLAPIRHSALIPYLGANMPVGVLTILVVYTLRHTPMAADPTTGAAAVALAVTAGLHLWRRNAVLSIFAGTAVYTVAASLIAARR